MCRRYVWSHKTSNKIYHDIPFLLWKTIHLDNGDPDKYEIIAFDNQKSEFFLSTTIDVSNG